MNCRLLLVFTAFAVPAVGQGISAADSAALVALVAAEARRDYPTMVAGPFVRDTARGGFGPFATRVLAVVRDGDTDVGATPTRTTPRLSISEVVVARDTATVTVMVFSCTERIGYGATTGMGRTYRYVRDGEGWRATDTRLMERGHGAQCPW